MSVEIEQQDETSDVQACIDAMELWLDRLRRSVARGDTPAAKGSASSVRRWAEQIEERIDD